MLKIKVSMLLPCPDYKLSPLFMAMMITTISTSSLAAQTTPLKEFKVKESKSLTLAIELKRQSLLLEAQSKAIEQLKSQLGALNKSNIKNKVKTPPKKMKNTVVEVKPVGKAPAKKNASANVPDLSTVNNKVGGVLTGEGSFIVEPSFGYSYTDNNRVFLDGYTFIPSLVVGVIDLREVHRHSFVSSIAARYGILDRWEVEVKLPYIARKDTQRSRPVSIDSSQDQIFNASGKGMGDLELSTRFQINSGQGGNPIYVANLAATIPTGVSPYDVDYVTSTAGSKFPTELPTGSGYISILPSLSIIYPSDPGVLFGNVNYGYTMATDEVSGEIDSGDSIGLSFGLGLSLNARTSLNLSYSHKHVFKSEINGQKVNGSELDIGQFIVGYSFRYSTKMNVNLSVGIGTTDDAPDVRLTMRFPMTF